MTTPAKVYRRSELEAATAGCLYRYDQIWNKGVPDESDIATLGIGFHAIQHAYTLALVEAHVPQDAELAAQAFTEGVASAKIPTHLLPELRQVWFWHAERWELNLDEFVTAEERGSSGDVGFTPDLVTANVRENILTVEDFKSGWAPPVSEDELRGLYQARVYIRYAKDRWPNFSGYRFRLHAVRFNKVVEVIFTQQELDEIELEVRAAIAAIERAREENVWPVVAGPSCRFCTLRCPLMDQPMLMPKRFVEASQAQQFAGWVLAADGMVKAAKKALKAYVAAHGPVSVNGVVFDNRESVSVSYAIDVVMEVLNAAGIVGAFEDAKQQGLTISRSSLAKLIKVYPQIEKDLEKFAIKKSVYRFSAKQAGEDDSDE